ncbi:hypothetical protein [Pontibacter chinhatensis]|uniref:Uncharacterized protein n=1 Tax=Pontibacter chinhatensis TaxID=1436961 RepID=A0A1I2VC70_9BACT|nr:hypothetical protein [Pontibacter chinhatensis]SFG86955.1 hypothetical protein SAMN05421739_104134 [Pontibacter chinhatensis]
MKTILLLLLLLPFTTLNSYSQTTGSYQIEITANASASQSEFKIHLTKGVDTAKVIYSKRKQNDLQPTKQDSLEIQELTKAFMNDLEAQKRLSQIFEKYKSYEKDSLIIPSNHLLLCISDSLSRESILNVDETNRSRFVLDGTRVKVKVRHESGPEYELYAVSPRRDTYPLLFQFIEAALLLYRNAVEDPILNKCDTLGY